MVGQQQWGPDVHVIVFACSVIWSLGDTGDTCCYHSGALLLSTLQSAHWFSLRALFQSQQQNKPECGRVNVPKTALTVVNGKNTPPSLPLDLSNSRCLPAFPASETELQLPTEVTGLKSRLLLTSNLCWVSCLLNRRLVLKSLSQSPSGGTQSKVFDNSFHVLST